MQFPQINLNGTPGESLRAEYRAAYDAVNAAINAVSHITVHGRDYQTLTGPAFFTAQSEHYGRLRELEKIRADLAALYAEVDRQLIERSPA